MTSIAWRPSHETSRLVNEAQISIALRDRIIETTFAFNFKTFSYWQEHVIVWYVSDQEAKQCVAEFYAVLDTTESFLSLLLIGWRCNRFILLPIGDSSEDRWWSRNTIRTILVDREQKFRIMDHCFDFPDKLVTSKPELISVTRYLKIYLWHPLNIFTFMWVTVMWISELCHQASWWSDKVEKWHWLYSAMRESRL